MRRTWQTYYQPQTLDAAFSLLGQYGSGARVIAGGTDVVVELSRGVKPARTLIDITRIPDLQGIRDEGETVRLGAVATHNDVLASATCRSFALPLAQACLEIGAPQLRGRATVAGNLVTASPANDTYSALIALDASVTIASAAGDRTVPVESFSPGFRQTVLQPGELVVAVTVPKLTGGQRGIYRKLGLRRAQAISVIHLAIVLDLDGDLVRSARVAYGCLAPTVVRGLATENFLIGNRLTPETCAEAGRIALRDVSPIDDIRGTAAYRLATLERLVADSLHHLATGREAAGFPGTPILLRTHPSETPPQPGEEVHCHSELARNLSACPVASEYRLEPMQCIQTTINGTSVTWQPASARKTLLDALREDSHLTGAKEGCAEGECGACTVWLDGQAVMSCLVPAAQAQGAEITTIEGLADRDGTLHPLQQAFIDQAAVQCGFCIPGMLMAGAKLLGERPEPDIATIQMALSGNLCRCTGYRKILAAVGQAATDSMS